VKPAEKTAASAPAPAAAPPAPVQASVQAPTPAQAPAQALVQTPAQAIVEPLSPPRDVAALPTPQAAIEIPETAAKVIEAPATQAAGSAVSATVAAPSTQTSRLVPVMRTHLLPPYPLDAKRAGEQGTTQMEVSISTLGAITDCRVTGSSGSERLDTTACSFVKRYWRWQPPTRDGREVPATTKISVIWNLIAGR
jgi:TonB family protein